MARKSRSSDSVGSKPFSGGFPLFQFLYLIGVAVATVVYFVWKHFEKK